MSKYEYNYDTILDNYDSISDLLDDIYPAHLASKKNVSASLSDEDSKKLEDIALSILRGSSFDSAVNDLAPIFLKYERKDKAGNKLSSKPLALKLIQVFYLASIMHPEVKQIDIITKFASKGASINKKLFNKSVYITDSANTLMFNPPKPHIQYQGGKHGDLATAIRYLLFQAGDYNTFVDIFGGSGMATASFIHNPKLSYIYNDLDSNLCRLFDVIQSEDYEKLINYIDLIKSDLQAIKGVEVPFRPDFTLEIQVHRDNSRPSKEEQILLDWLEANIELPNPYEYLKTFIDALYKLPNEIFQPFVDKYYPALSDKSKNPDVSMIIGSYYAYYNETVNFCRENLIPTQSVYVNNEKTMEGWAENRQEQYRFYEWWIYFDNLLKGISQTDDKVLIALAEIYLWSFLTNGSKGLSSIHRIFSSEAKDNDSNSYLQFINKDFKSLLTEMHNTIRGSIVENLSCFDVIPKYSDKDTIYYSDYPYLGTSGYIVGGWSAQDSINLISALEETGKRYIFSCRACISSKNIDDNLRKSNQDLLNSVFKQFKTAKYVTYINLKGVSLEEAIRGSMVTEIMITNFTVQPFNDRAKFEVYTFEDFLQMLDNSLIL